jgi:predicted phage replisome organizer
MIRVSQRGLQMSKRYYWLKLKDDFFIDPKIKKLRKIAGGDTYTVILLKLMLLTLKTDGILIFEGIEETLQGELSLKLDEDENNINATLIFMEKMQLIVELDAYRYSLPQMALLTGSETDAAKRKRKERANKKTKSVTLSQPSHKSVTLEKENKREELEKERDTEKEAVEKWLNEKSKNANNPHTYKAKMRQLIEVQDRDALEEFHSWSKDQYESAIEKAFTKTVDEFDYSPLKKLNGKPIQNVVSDKGTSYLDIHFEDGSYMSVLKEQIYLSITQGGATHESL